jgi:hypothetical protein
LDGSDLRSQFALMQQARHSRLQAQLGLCAVADSEPPFMPDRFLEEGLGCGHIACPAQPEVDGLPGFVYGSIQVDPSLHFSKHGLAFLQLQADRFEPDSGCRPLHTRYQLPFQDAAVEARFDPNSRNSIGTSYADSVLGGKRLPESTTRSVPPPTLIQSLFVASLQVKYSSTPISRYAATSFCPLATYMPSSRCRGNWLRSHCKTCPISGDVGRGDQVDLNVSLDSSSCTAWRNMASERFVCLALHCLQVRATPNVAEMCVLAGPQSIS